MRFDVRAKNGFVVEVVSRLVGSRQSNRVQSGRVESSRGESGLRRAKRRVKRGSRDGGGVGGGGGKEWDARRCYSRPSEK